MLRRSARYVLVQRGFLFLVVLVGAALVLTAATMLTRAMGDVESSAQAIAVGVGVALLAVCVIWILVRLQGRISRRIDKAFFRKYQSLSDHDKKRMRQILDAWEREP